MICLKRFPYAFANIIDFADHASKGLHIFTVFIAHFNSTINPYVYMLLNPGFKKFYSQLKNNKTGTMIEPNKQRILSRTLDS
jgi:hypothetical protein